MTNETKPEEQTPVNIPENEAAAEVLEDIDPHVGSIITQVGEFLKDVGEIENLDEDADDNTQEKAHELFTTLKRGISTIVADAKNLAFESGVASVE